METVWMFVKAFVVGGLICCVGQALLMHTGLTSARILVLFVVAGVVLTALGVYKPLTGFGYSLAMGAMEAVHKYGFFGAFTGGIQNTAAGVATAILFGLLNALIFKPKAKP